MYSSRGFESQVSRKDMNSLFSSSFKSSEEEETEKNGENLLDSDTQHHQQMNQRQPNSGLLRFRSAPSSFMSNLKGWNENFVNPSCSSSEAERLIARFASRGGDIESDFGYSSYNDLEKKSVGCSSALPPRIPAQLFGSDHATLDTSPFKGMNSMAMDEGKSVSGASSNLVRQNSSPAGLFSNINVRNGYATMRSARNTRVGSGSNGLPSFLGQPLSRICENGDENICASSPEKFENNNGGNQFYGPGFSYGSWSDSLHFAEDISGMKRDRDGDGKLYSSSNASGTQNEEAGNRLSLSHHLSLPKSQAEVIAMEKLLHFQDSVPCKIRAKRGCATHPRSIAERVRRTRISERMRKLQELVPNMDKQTSTADMLDLAVEYIKDLQKQYKTLSESRAKCKCLGMQKSLTDQTV